MKFYSVETYPIRDSQGEWERAQKIEHADLIRAFGEAQRDWEVAVENLATRFHTSTQCVWKMKTYHYVPNTGFYCLDKATVENVLAFGIDDWSPAMEALGITEEQLRELTDYYQICTDYNTGRPGACIGGRVAMGPED